MRYRVIAVLSVVLLALAGAGPTAAQDKKDDVKGLFLLTDYPAVTLRPGTNSTINLRLQNYNLPPERLALSVAGAPAGWTATLIGGGQPIAAALPATNSSVSFELRVDVPKEAPVGTTNLTVSAKGASSEVSLPVAITVFGEDAYRPPETWARRAFPSLAYYHEVDKGGHFAAWEQPELFAAELRAAFASLRTAP